MGILIYCVSILSLTVCVFLGYHDPTTCNPMQLYRKEAGFLPLSGRHLVIIICECSTTCIIYVIKQGQCECQENRYQSLMSQDSKSRSLRFYGWF